MEGNSEANVNIQKGAAAAAGEQREADERQSADDGGASGVTRCTA